MGSSFWEAADEIPSIIGASHYARHLPKWIETFGRDQIHILFQEDIRDRPREVLQEVYRFLSVKQPSKYPRQVKSRVNVASLPRFPILARQITRLARWLRERRLHRVVELGKKLGLRGVYGGGNSKQESVAPDLRSKLVQEFEADVQYVEEITGRQLTEWKVA